jgi:catechol 2,3-dioxygenase-like lactoylglutathione lyase family enzyme
MYIKSVIVDDQKKAKEFYTNILGFKVKHDIPMGEHNWLTLISPEEDNSIELALEPNVYPAAKSLQASLMKDGIPYTAFSVADMDKEYERLSSKGVEFTSPPKDMGDFKLAVFNDTCGNLIQIIEQ